MREYLLVLTTDVNHHFIGNASGINTEIFQQHGKLCIGDGLTRFHFNAAVCSNVFSNAMHRQIDDMAVSMIARRQPMAVDLRAIITCIHVAGDLERVGDMAKTVARRTLQIEGLSLTPKFYNGVKHMSDLILRQLKAALDAYANRNGVAAVEVCNSDDEIDALYTSLFRELLTYMMEDPRNITQCTQIKE